MSLPGSGRVASVTLWGAFHLGAGWYPTLERFWQMDDAERHLLPGEVQANRLRRKYSSRSLFLHSQAGLRKRLRKRSRKPKKSDGSRLM